MYDNYAVNSDGSPGVAFVLVVGQNSWQGPATVADAAQYKAQHGYQDGWIGIADPHWSGIDSVIATQTNTLPNMQVLDGNMTMVHTTTAWSWINDAAAAVAQVAATTP